MDVLEAMEAVTKCLLAQDLIGAQHQVLNIEANGSVLPSSTFERVLKAAVHANCLLPAYREFCERSYGRQQFTDLLLTIKIIARFRPSQQRARAARIRELMEDEGCSRAEAEALVAAGM